MEKDNIVKETPEFNLKPLQIYGGWYIHWNHFSDLEPDNDFDKDDILFWFTEDMCYFTYGKDRQGKNIGEKSYFIDLGFTESIYNRDKNKGYFQLVVAEGDFCKGIVYEYFISRSTDEIQQKINDYIRLISTGKIGEYKGLVFDNEKSIYYHDYLFSAIDRTKEVFDNKKYL